MIAAMNGQCLCGGVTWSTSAGLRDVWECHCRRCTRVTGNYMAATAAPTDQLEIAGDSLAWFAPDDDRNVAYGFCNRCGSSLFFRSGTVDGTNEITSICAGSIVGPSGLRTSAIWFTDDAADHVRIDESIPTFATQPEL